VLSSGGRLAGGAGMVLKVGVVAAAMVTALLTSIAPADALEIRFQETPVAGWSVNGVVYAVHLSGETVYVGGSFSAAVSPEGDITRERHNLAAFDRVSGELLSFRADTNSTVRGISADGNTVWVGGYFTEIGGEAHNRIAALNATTGAVRSGFSADINGRVWDVEFAAGKVFVAGEFGSVSAASHRRVASLDPVTGSPDSGFSARGSGTVRTLAYSEANETLYAGGSFTSIGGTSRDQLAGLDPATGNAKGVAFAKPGSLVHEVDVHSDGSMVFAAVGGTENRVHAWSTASGSKRWNRRAMGDVQAVGYEDGRVYFGFHEGYGGSTSVRMLAANASNGSLDNSFRPSINSFYGVWAIDAAPGGLIAGGEFTRVEGVKARRVAIFPRDGIPDLQPPSRPGGIYAHAASATSIEVAWEPSTDDVGVHQYIVRRDGAMVGTSPVATYLDTGLQPSAEYRYTIEAIDSVERSSGQSVGTTLATWSTVVAPGATWRYTDVGSAPSGWKQVGFDDSGWQSGNAQLGFGEGDEATAIERGEIAYYFRHEFATPGGREVLDAAVALVRDDGAVVYVNGTEVLRSNMPSGPITAATPAASTTGGGDESRWFTGVVSASLFRPGTNVIAVEVHQRNTNSSDVSFDLAVDGELSDEPYDQVKPTKPKGLVATAKSPTRIRLDWRAASDNRAVAGYRVFRDGVEIGFTEKLKYVDRGLEPERKYRYKVRAVDTSLNSGPRSRIRRATTLPDTDPPTKPRRFELRSATGSTVTLGWNPSKDNVAVDHYIVRRDGTTIASTTDTSYVMTGLDPLTEYHFAVRAVDSSGNKSAKAHENGETTPLIVTFTAVAAGSAWRYHDEGDDLGEAWRNRNYDDSGWDSGSAELGYGDGDESTVVGSGPDNDHHITTYFRAEFSIGSPDEVPVMLLRMVRDDGAVVYLNGTEVARSNMPGGTINFRTRATAGVSGSAERDWHEFFIDTSVIRSGRNVVSVEIHQSGPRSSDISFDLALIANPQ